MDLSVTAATAYLPVQAYAQQAGTRDQAATEQAAAARGAARTDTMAISPEAQQARDEATRRKDRDPATEAAASPGFRFEYQDHHRVMKVHNSKGYLIYQVPSKGQLALIQAEEGAQQPGRQIELTA